MKTLRDRTVIVTGASRGIGRAIARRAAQDGANVVVAAKSAAPGGKLPGTIHEVAAEVEALGGRALPLKVDVRDAERLEWMVARTVAAFGGVDVLVHNAGAIWLAPSVQLPVKRFDLMFEINVRAVFVATRACIPHLRRSTNGHVLSLAPPLAADPRWFAGHAPYTTSKYAMSLLTLGLAAELREDGIAANTLWPRTTIATAAIAWLGGDGWIERSRRPEIMADAFHAVVTRPARECSGQSLIDEEVLRERGITDFSDYAVHPGRPLLDDLFVGGGPERR